MALAIIIIIQGIIDVWKFLWKKVKTTYDKDKLPKIITLILNFLKLIFIKIETSKEPSIKTFKIDIRIDSNLVKIGLLKKDIESILVSSAIGELSNKMNDKRKKINKLEPFHFLMDVSARISFLVFFFMFNIV